MQQNTKEIRKILYSNEVTNEYYLHIINIVILFHSSSNLEGLSNKMKNL